MSTSSNVVGNVFDSSVTASADGSVTIEGDLTVEGTTTSIDTVNLTVEDKLIELAHGTAGAPSGDAGIIIERGSSTNASLIWDESADEWVISTTSATGASSGDLTLTDANLRLADVTVSGGDVGFGNGQNATVSVAATAHGAAGKNVTLTAGPTTAGTTNNIAGGSVTIQGGQGKGSGAGGDIIFQTANASGSGSSLNALATALTISDDKSATFEDNVVVKGNIALDDGGSLTEAGGTTAFTFDGSGNVTKIGQDSMTSGDVLTWDGAKFVGEVPTVGDITAVTAGDGLTGGGNSGAVSLAVGAGTGIDVAADAISVDVSDFMANGSDNRVITATGADAMNAEANLSFDGSTLAVTGALTTTTTATVGTDLTVSGGDATFGTAGNTTATTISTIVNTGTTVGKALTIAAGSTTTGSNNLNGGDLVLASGSGDGTGTSSIQFKTKVSGTDVAAERMRIHTDGNVGIGTSAPGNLIHAAGADAYLLLQNTTAEHSEGGAETRVLFGDHSGAGLAMIEGSHSGTSDDTKGKFVVATHNGSAITPALTIDDTQKSTFAGIVDIDGAVTIDPGSSSGTGVTLTHTDVDALAMSVVASNTTADVLSVTANALTSGKVLSAQTSAATGLFLDQNYTLTTASTIVGLDIDFDKTGASTSNNTMIGINLDMDNTTPTGGTNSMTGIKVTPTCTQVSGTGGTFNIKGMEVVATGSDAPEGSTVRALELTATGGDYNQGILINTDDANGWDMKIVSSADAADFCTIAVAANGATTLTTTDGGGTNADLTFAVNGSIDMDSADNVTIDAADEIVVTTTSADGHIALVSAHTAGVALHIDADANAGSIVDIDAGILDIDVTGAATIDAASLTVTTDTATFTSANSTDPVVQIKNTTNDANGARLQFVKDKGAAGAANDIAGIIEFIADDANQDQVLFGAIASAVDVHTNGQESGKITLDVASHDGELNTGLTVVGGAAEDEVNVTLGNGAGSIVDVEGMLGVGDTAPKVSLNVMNDYHTVTFENQLADGQGGGQILRFGSDATLVLGGLYYLKSDGVWTGVNANAVATGATQLLGISMGTDAQVGGLLLNGFVRIPATEILNLPGSGVVEGLPLYLSTTAAHLDFTAPSGGGDFVRIAGYAIDDDSSAVLVYFNPDSTHVEL
tara:strand:- start:3359 stop:6805 length:3447 start_codon:yes stop_codon:yes gene_type:complete